jgi:hypothetical protein
LLWYNLSMCWAVAAAIAASAGLLFSIFIFIFPHIQRRKRRPCLSKIKELKREAIKLQNEHCRALGSKELDVFKTKVRSVKARLLDEIREISKDKAQQYEDFGEVDVKLFWNVKNEEQKIYLGVIRRCWGIADEVINKYS